MDFVSDSLANGRRIKFLTVADDFSHECVDISVDWGISGLYAIKQNLKIKRFFGESENAVRIQLLTALVAYLLVILMKAGSACKRNLKKVLDELRQASSTDPNRSRPAGNGDNERYRSGSRLSPVYSDENRSRTAVRLRGDDLHAQ